MPCSHSVNSQLLTKRGMSAAIRSVLISAIVEVEGLIYELFTSVLFMLIIHKCKTRILFYSC